MRGLQTATKPFHEVRQAQFVFCTKNQVLSIAKVIVESVMKFHFISICLFFPFSVAPFSKNADFRFTVSGM